MIPRCQLCGTFESENTSIIPDFDACHECITSLVENEIERRGEARDAQAQADGGGLYDAETFRMIEAQHLKR